MSQAILDVINRIKEFNYLDQVTKIVEEHSQELIDLQKEQLTQGIDKNGERTVGSYSEQYEQFKKRHFSGIGLITSNVTFYATGDLYSLLQLVIDGENFKIKTPDPKFQYMINRMNFSKEDIDPNEDTKYGISPDNVVKYAENITLPLLRQAFYDFIRS